MPKYKNKSEFTRPVNINGKRIALKPRDIIFSERELDVSIYDFLEKVDDKIQATTKVIELGPQKLKVATPNDIRNVHAKIDSIQNSLKSTPEEVTVIKKEQEKLKESLDIILKRLEVMKSAVEQVSSENESLKGIVHDLETEVYENGAIIIQGLDDTTETKE